MAVSSDFRATGPESAAAPPVHAPTGPEERPAPLDDSAPPVESPVTLEEVAEVIAPEKESWGRWGALALGALVIVAVVFVLLSQISPS
jgi:hypothetical protein